MPKNENGLESRTNRWMVAGLVLMLIGVLAFPLYRIYEPTARAQAAEETQSKLALAGESLWSSTCASCHGSFGQGVDAPALNSIQFLSVASNAQIVAIASAGVPGTEMSAYGQAFGGPLTQEQIVSLAACIRSWEDTAPDRPDWRDMIGEPGGHDEGGDAAHDETPADTDGDGTADHDEAPADTDGDGADDHDEAPADTDGDGADDHDAVATTEGPAACGPNYDPTAFEDHDDDGADDHDEVPADATDHDEVPADDDGDGPDDHDG